MGLKHKGSTYVCIKVIESTKKQLNDDGNDLHLISMQCCRGS